MWAYNHSKCTKYETCETLHWFHTLYIFFDCIRNHLWYQLILEKSGGVYDNDIETPNAFKTTF